MAETVDSSPPNKFTSSHPPPLQLDRFKNAEMHSNIGNTASVHKNALGLELSLDTVCDAAGLRISALLDQMQED